jgi:hypothetical protein
MSAIDQALSAIDRVAEEATSPRSAPATLWSLNR